MHCFSLLCNFHTIFFLIGLEKIVQMLIDRGANINAVNQNGSSALSFAADEGNVIGRIFTL